MRACGRQQLQGRRHPPRHLAAGDHPGYPTKAFPASVSDDPEVERDAVLAGIGYGQITACLAMPHIRAGRSVTVLDDYRPPPWGLYVYRPQRGPVPARIRLVFDHIVETPSSETAFLDPIG